MPVLRFSVCTKLLDPLARETRRHFVADVRPKALGRNEINKSLCLDYFAREATMASATLRGASV